MHHHKWTPSIDHSDTFCIPSSCNSDSQDHCSCMLPAGISKNVNVLHITYYRSVCFVIILINVRQRDSEPLPIFKKKTTLILVLIIMIDHLLSNQAIRACLRVVILDMTTVTSMENHIKQIISDFIEKHIAHASLQNRSKTHIKKHERYFSPYLILDLPKSLLN